MARWQLPAEEFPPGTYDVVFIDPSNNVAVGAIEDIIIGIDAVVIDQDMPIDPAGVIYNAVTGLPVAGAIVTLTTADGTPLPDECLLTNQQRQVTGANGQYRFDIRVGASPLCGGH
ncbi:MAG: hypothetical protein U5K75_09985 [Ahrensia sp.]|nr:hypothetical protein [Ahrensia sp.]